MATPQRQGFLADLGMNINPEEIMRAQREQQRAQALGMAANMGYRTSYEQTAGNVGALLGARLAKPEGLTADQMAKVAAQDASNTRMKKWLSENKEAPAAQQEEQYMRFVSEAAFENGLPDVGAQAAGMYEQLNKAREKQDLELTKLRNSADASQYEPESARLGVEGQKQQLLASQGKGKLVPIWGFGDTDPNKSRMGFINEDGSVTLADGQQLQQGQYTTKSPEVPNVWGRGGRGAGGATPTEMGQVRQRVAALHARSRTIKDLKSILDESVDKTGTMAATGKAGQLASFVSRWSNDLYNLVAVSGGGGAFTAIGRDGKEYSLDTASGRKQLSKQYASVIDEYLPPEFTATAELADRYRSLVTELMYVEARSNESGAKQFSDADIQRNAAIIGANVNNPEALRQILLSSYERAYDRNEFELSMYDPALIRANVSPESLEKIAQDRDEIRELFGQGWGGHTVPGDKLGTQSTPDAEGFTVVNGRRVRKAKGAQ